MPGHCQNNGGPSQVDWIRENPGVPQLWGFGIGSGGHFSIEGARITNPNNYKVQGGLTLLVHLENGQSNKTAYKIRFPES